MRLVYIYILYSNQPLSPPTSDPIFIPFLTTLRLTSSTIQPSWVPGFRALCTICHKQLLARIVLPGAFFFSLLHRPARELCSVFLWVPVINTQVNSVRGNPAFFDRHLPPPHYPLLTHLKKNVFCFF